MAAIAIRRAQAGDADAAAKLLCASIRDLCHEDHAGDEAVVAAWLANKTPENLALWIADPGAIMLVAEQVGVLAGVGAIRRDGEVMLNYVAPWMRFRGVSRAMIAALEDEARALGLSRVHLSSTRTARRFYRSRGYAATGPAEVWHGIPGYPMARSLS